MFRKVYRYLTGIFLQQNGVFTLSGKDPFQQAHLKLNLKLTLAFSVCGLLYALTFVHAGHYFPAVLTLISSLAVLLIPFAVFKLRSLAVFYGLVIPFGIVFAAINIYGTGDENSMSILLWQIFIVHLGFSVLARRAALFFGSVVVAMVLVKYQLVQMDVHFPYLIDEHLVKHPRMIDIVVPAFFNFYLAFVSNKLLMEARQQYQEAGRSIQQLGKQVEQTESKYQLLVDQGLGFFVIYSITGKILYANRALYITLGYKISEILSLRIRDLLDDSVRAGFEPYLDGLVRHGSQHGIVKVRSQAGAIYYWSFRNITFHDELGEVRVFGFAQDVTELIHARKKIQRHEQELEALVSSLNDVVMLLDEDDSLIQCWSHINVLPDPRDCYGKNVAEILSILFKDDSRPLDAYHRARQTASPVELTVPTRNPDIHIWFDIRVSPIAKGGKKMMSILLRNVTDVHERNLAEKAAMLKGHAYKSAVTKLSLSDLTAERDPLETLATICSTVCQTMGVQRTGLWLFTSNRAFIENVIAVNKDTVDLLGYGKGPLLKVDDFPRYFKSLQEGDPIVANDAQNHEGTSELLDSYLRPNGIVSMLDVPLLLHSELVGVICFEHTDAFRYWDEKDVELAKSVATLCTLAMEGHRRKKVQQELEVHALKLEDSYHEVQQMTQHLMVARARAEESDRLKSLFLANISHEIRTPMNAIIGFAELLERPKLDEFKRREFSRMIRERSMDLLGIINNVLDMSGIESGHVTLMEVEGNVDELLDRIVSSVKDENRYLQGKDISFQKTNALSPSQYTLRLDFIRLYQVLYNLMTNAAKFTKEGSIELECRLKDSDTLWFTVRDTGIGISTEKQAKLFRPFMQADESIFRKYGGSGLGLAICKGFVDLMQGTIWVESVEGKGSAFHFTVAIQKANREQPTWADVQQPYAGV